ncbi:MAG: hypothetical protein JW821_12895 [Deltaproteobacteria bacterium]|nr:hypothetical protein [Deltaproteobacteria bacterium]
MPWIQRISHLDVSEKEGLYRILVPPSLYHRFGIDPLRLQTADGRKVVRMFSPRGDRTCLVEVQLGGSGDPLYSLQLSDTQDATQIELDFVIVNDPFSEKFHTNVDEDGRDTLFGWASRNLAEERRAMDAGLFPGQIRKGIGLTREVVYVLDFFCRTLDIKSIKLEALFYHNAITYERYGFSYFSGYAQMKRIHELFHPGRILCEKMDGSTPFRDPGFSGTVRGRSWAIHDGILLEIEDDVLDDGWVSPVMYRMVDRPRGMITFPDPVY